MSFCAIASLLYQPATVPPPPTLTSISVPMETWDFLAPLSLLMSPPHTHTHTQRHVCMHKSRLRRELEGASESDVFSASTFNGGHGIEY